MHPLEANPHYLFCVTVGGPWVEEGGWDKRGGKVLHFTLYSLRFMLYALGFAAGLSISLLMPVKADFAQELNFDAYRIDVQIKSFVDVSIDDCSREKPALYFPTMQCF